MKTASAKAPYSSLFQYSETLCSLVLGTLEKGYLIQIFSLGIVTRMKCKMLNFTGVRTPSIPTAAGGQAVGAPPLGVLFFRVKIFRDQPKRLHKSLKYGGSNLPASELGRLASYTLLLNLYLYLIILS